jgi:hypothetical protein
VKGIALVIIQFCCYGKVNSVQKQIDYTMHIGANKSILVYVAAPFFIKSTRKCSTVLPAVSL